MTLITFTMLVVMMLMMILMLLMMFTRVEFGHGSVTTVVCRRHRAFDDRAGDGDVDGHAHGQ